jgi:hypothetical protein
VPLKRRFEKGTHLRLLYICTHTHTHTLSLTHTHTHTHTHPQGTLSTCCMVPILTRRRYPSSTRRFRQVRLSGTHFTCFTSSLYIKALSLRLSGTHFTCFTSALYIEALSHRRLSGTLYTCRLYLSLPLYRLSLYI